MNNRPPPSLSKIPFLLGDILLLAAACAVEFLSPTPPTIWNHLLAVFAVGLGAILLVIPFLREHESQIELMNTGGLTSSLAQIKKLEDMGRQVSASTAHWQSIQDQAGKTVQQVTDVSEKITTEARQISEFILRANETEKNHLRLEVEKLRRAEAEWLQVVVRLLDNAFALYQAAERSGQTSVIEQIGQFQFACRDTARRMGLNTVTVAPGDFYENERHQIYEGPEPPPGTRIASMLATGISFQGHLVRKVLVTAQENISTSEVSPAEPAAELAGTTRAPEPDHIESEAGGESAAAHRPEKLPAENGSRHSAAENESSTAATLPETAAANPAVSPESGPQADNDPGSPENQSDESENRKKQRSSSEWSNQPLLF